MRRSVHRPIVLSAGLTVAVIVGVVVLGIRLLVPSAAAASVACPAITFAVEARLGPPAGRELTREAVHEMSRLSGIPFVERDPADKGTVLRITWVHGDGAWRPQALARAAGDWVVRQRLARLRAGEVLMRAVSDDVPAGVDWSTVLRHELGHVLGLRHRIDAGDVMFATATPTAKRWSDDDVSALAALGRRAGCVGVPLRPRV